MCRSILDSLHEGVYFVDLERRITFWNRGAERITGYGRDEAVGARCAERILAHVDAEGNSLCVSGCPLARALADGEPHEADVYLRHRDGQRVPVHVLSTPIRDANGDLVGVAEAFHEAAASVAMHERLRELEKLVLTDELTRVGNRRHAEATIVRLLAEMKRFGWPFGLLFVDVDGFKEVNDFSGHHTGDRVLRMVAATLSANVRSVDDVARWAGDEFVVTCANVDERHLLTMADRVRTLVDGSGYGVDSPLIRVTVSVGATFAWPGDTLASLVRRADKLMYRSKYAGGNRVTAGLIPGGDVAGAA